VASGAASEAWASGCELFSSMSEVVA
jgi:hypothetical protein